MRTPGNPTDCYDMLRMFSTESLALFLWTVGAPQSVRQQRNRFVRSPETCNRKFEKVLACLINLAKDIIYTIKNLNF